MFDSVIQNIVQSLLKNNPVFGNNGFYYKNSLELTQNGITDQLMNMFYVRSVIKGARKYKIGHGDLLNTITGSFRIVIQLLPEYNHPIQALCSQMDEKDFGISELTVIVTGYNDDSDQVYLTETGKPKEFENMNLYSIDFDLTVETSKFSCDFKSIEKC